tara:strand:+ start:11062 stop:11832 length:771 start_codon:yes stop_codon:yes gene_type:complete
MSATGCACGEELVRADHGRALLERCARVAGCLTYTNPVISLRHNDQITVTGVGGGEWFVSRSLLQQNSWLFHRELSDMTRTTLELENVEDQPFELFLQWLLQCRYDKHEGFALDLVQDYSDLELYDHDDGNVMDREVKAAFLACDAGACLEAPLFQNYAMRRLFDAYSNSNTTSSVFAFMLEEANRCDKLQMFLEDLAIRHWGDESIVFDHNAKAWSQLLKENQRFREKFPAAMAMDRTARQQEPMKVDKYLIKDH